MNYELIILGILLGILPLWHTHTFLFFGGSLFIWLLFNPSTNKNLAMKFRALLLVFIPATIIALPSLIWFTQQVSHESFIKFRLGWMDSNDQPLLFWLKNTGLFLPLALIGLLKFKKRVRVFFLPAWIVLIIVNLIQFQPWDWDNIKLLSWSFLFLSIAVGHVLSLIFYKNIFGKVITFILFISLIFSGILSVIHQADQTYTIYDTTSIDLADWIKKNTQPDDIFVIDPWPNHPVPGLSGRSAYVGYPGQLWVHGIDYHQRERQTKQILQGNLTILSQTDVPISYIVGPPTSQSQFKNQLPIVFQNRTFVIYDARSSMN